MTNCLLAFPDYVLADSNYVTVAFSGGSWSGSLPLSNLLSDDLSKIARSTNAATSSTKFTVDLGTLRTVAAVALLAHNGSRDALIRARGYNTTGAPTIDVTVPSSDSGWVALYGTNYPFGSVPYGSTSYWDGKLTEEDAAIFPMPWLFIPPNGTLARYWHIEISDAGNSSGYFQIGRVVIAGGWQPSVNMIYGAGVGYEDNSTPLETMGGAKFFEKKAKRRLAAFSFDYVEEDEALTFAFDMQARLGVSGQLLFSYDPADTYHKHRRTFLARMRRLNMVEAAAYGCSKVAYEIEEVL
jgi:hypothetical protein